MPLKGNTATANLSLSYYMRKKEKPESSSLSNILNKSPDYCCKSARSLSIDLTEPLIRSPFISTSSLQSLAIAAPLNDFLTKLYKQICLYIRATLLTKLLKLIYVTTYRFRLLKSSQWVLPANLQSLFQTRQISYSCLY